MIQKNSFYLVKSKVKIKSIFISEQVISELKKQAWKPNSLTRFGFYKFLRRAKRELKISVEIELSPHTLRNCFTTYSAESGVTLGVLKELLGHESVRTTALYWRSDRKINQKVVREWLDEPVYQAKEFISLRSRKRGKISGDY
ncbi:MAG: tyrosine recombinase XerD [Mycoplasmataceae bacterium RC_NB112A]|nr:MAG: tyrosine recombinase XerD [Mycoplasmataceae bacterium RC_NB112A]